MDHVGSVSQIVVDCLDPPRLAGFWASLLGGAATTRDPAWVTVQAGPTRLAFQRVPEAKATKNRLHIDVEVDDLPAATQRCIDLGATATGQVVHDDAGAFQVMLDPERNEYCLVT